MSARTAAACQSLRLAAQRRRKYIPDAAIDQRIEQAYDELLRANDRTALKRAAADIGWPDHAVKRRAQHLGLARVKESPWSEAEIEILERYAFMTPDRIAVHLRNAGFQRSVTGVLVKRKRLRLRASADGWTPNGVADLLFCDAHLVYDWIRRGLLKTGPRGGDGSRWVRYEWLRSFLVAYPDEWDSRKVPTEVLVYLLAGEGSL